MNVLLNPFYPEIKRKAKRAVTGLPWLQRYKPTLRPLTRRRFAILAPWTPDSPGHTYVLTPVSDSADLAVRMEFSYRNGEGLNVAMDYEEDCAQEMIALLESMEVAP